MNLRFSFTDLAKKVLDSFKEAEVERFLDDKEHLLNVHGKHSKEQEYQPGKKYQVEGRFASNQVLALRFYFFVVANCYLNGCNKHKMIYFIFALFIIYFND